MSNVGHEFCVVGSRVSRKVWVAEFACSLERLLAWGCGGFGRCEVGCLCFVGAGGCQVLEPVGAGCWSWLVLVLERGVLDV
jgi:hypothetical protein